MFREECWGIADLLTDCSLSMVSNRRKMSDTWERKPKRIVYADQNADDRMLVAQALAEVCPNVTLYGLSDGQELLDYLYRIIDTSRDSATELPDLILIELNMAKKTGLEALAEIKAANALNQIPVVVFSTSNSERDKHNAFRLGASAFIRKPRSFSQLVKTILVMSEYWSDGKRDERRTFDKAC
jgi:CheY-like chemotaxis protein